MKIFAVIVAVISLFNFVVDMATKDKLGAFLWGLMTLVWTILAYFENFKKEDEEAPPFIQISWFFSFVLGLILLVRILAVFGAT